MKHLKISIIAGVLIFSGTVSAISADIKSECNPDEVDMVSIEDRNGGRIAEPGNYSNEICVSGIRDTEIRQSCSGGESALFSLFNRTGSNFTAITDFSPKICSIGLAATLKQNCGNNRTPIFSVESRNNSYVGEIDHYNKNLCLERTPPENITLTLNGVSGNVYADDTQISVGGEMAPPVEYPYIVSDQPLGLVSFGEFVQLSRPSSSEVSMTLSSGSFLVPFSSGGYREVERRQDEVLSREFLSLPSPSFGFSIPEEPVVKVAFQSPHNSTGFRGETQSLDLKVTNEGLKDSFLNLEFSRQE